MTELDAGRIAVRYVATETNSHVIVDVSGGFATDLASSLLVFCWDSFAKDNATGELFTAVWKRT